MVKLYFIGICILVIAILANAIIGKLGIMSWYDFLNALGNQGTSTFKELKIIDFVWLFVAYPLVLGSGYYLGDKLYSSLF